MKSNFEPFQSSASYIDVNQHSLRNNLEESSSHKRFLSIQPCVVETEKCITEKHSLAERGTQFNNIAIKIEQSGVIQSNTTIFQYSTYWKHVSATRPSLG